MTRTRAPRKESPHGPQVWPGGALRCQGFVKWEGKEEGLLGRANSLAKACAWSAGLAGAWDLVSDREGQVGGAMGGGQALLERMSGSEETQRDLYLGRVERDWGAGGLGWGPGCGACPGQSVLTWARLGAGRGGGFEPLRGTRELLS